MSLDSKAWEEIIRKLRNGELEINIEYERESLFKHQMKELKGKYCKTYKIIKNMLKTEEEIFKWLNTPNSDYDGLDPYSLLLKGKEDSLIGYLEDIKKGQLS